MSSTLTEPGSATRPGQGRRPPARLDHHNFYTSGLEATRHFYEDVAGLPLKVFYIDHGVLRSLYVRDPNGLLVEFAVDPDGHEEMYRMDHYGLPASGTAEDVIKQVGDAVSSWLAAHQ